MIDHVVSILALSYLDYIVFDKVFSSRVIFTELFQAKASGEKHVDRMERAKESKRAALLELFIEPMAGKQKTVNFKGAVTIWVVGGLFTAGVRFQKS